MPRLQDKFKKEILGKIQKDHSIKNPMQLPKLIKISVSMGLGQYHSEVKKIERCAEELATITGQKPVITKAKVSEASFKIRQGMPVGAMVTLRGARMWEFFDRFVNIAAPRIPDFHGFSRKGFDQAGNYAFGIKEQTIFPEVNLDTLEVLQGMNINVVFENSNAKISEQVLEALGFPFTQKRR